MKKFVLGTTLVYAMTYWAAVQGAPITWIAVDPNNDMEDPANWSSNSVPGSGDQAIFDSSIPGIALNPTESTNPFSVSSFMFIHNASLFNIQFNNQMLTFFGAGITGKMTDAFIDINNIDNILALGNLIQFLGTVSTSGSAQINLLNDAALGAAASNTNIGSIDSHFFADGDFTIGKEGVIFARNIGSDTANGTGNNVVANTDFSQMNFDETTTMEEGAVFVVSNNGTFSGLNTVQSNNVATITGSQLFANGAFQTDIDCFLDVRNEGTDQGQGVGGNQIGNIQGGQQASFQNGLSLGESAGISIQNRGTSSSNSASGSTVGCILSDGQQFLIKGTFLAEDGLSVFIQNAGTDNSTGVGGNTIACITNTAMTNTASQFHLDSGGTIGDNGSIFMLNSGSKQTSGASAPSKVSVLDRQQFYSAGTFQAGDNFNIQAISGGFLQGTGQTGHAIGVVGGNQIEFESTCVLGNNALFNLVNTGFNIDLFGTSNSISVIQGCQMKAGGDFTAGNNLSLLASNMAQNFGDTSNDVGLINDSQISFEQACNLNDGSLIRASNSGTVTNCQIEFLQGFNVLSGKAFIQAINTGTFGCFGIEILGNNAGGNAIIILSNSSLSVDTTLPFFTIGGLSGDSTSFAESNPPLIINTDTTTVVDFAGVIQDFPAVATSLIKDGPGTQILSGTNTYTGLTMVQGGSLVINGSIAKDILVETFGTLKGTGTIGGNLTNIGTVAPGQSIGTLNVLGNYFNNIGGIYAVEINGQGASDLINVASQARLNGGHVSVTTEDGIFLFQQPYTIVTAEEGVFGTYEGAVSKAFIDPILTYDPNHVYLTIESALIRAAEKCNQAGTATVLDAIINPTTSQALLLNAIVNLPLKEAQDALMSLSGYQYTHDVWMTEVSVRRFLRNLYNPLRSINCNDLFTTWIDTNEGFTRLHGKEAHKSHADTYQVTGGIQKTIFSNFTFGLAGSYEFDSLSFREGNAHRHSRFVAAYGLYDACPFYALFDFVYGHTSSKYKRTFQIPGIRDRAHSKPKTDIFTFYGEAGFDFCHECFLFQPFLGIQIGKNWRNHFKENSPTDLNLTIHKHDWNSTSSRLGIHLTTDYCGVEASLDVAWNELLSCHKNRTTGRFIQFGDSFPICGNDLSKTSIDYALTFSLCLCERWRGYVEFAGEKWSHASTYEILGGLEYSW